MWGTKLKETGGALETVADSWLERGPLVVCDSRTLGSSLSPRDGPGLGWSTGPDTSPRSR